MADEVAPLAREVEEAFARARLVVLSGGLGPTPDDVTREAVALPRGSGWPSRWQSEPSR